MVLHNNKWDRRAKHRYLKKHGISANEVNHATRTESSADPEDSSDDEQVGEGAHEIEEDTAGTQGGILPPLPDLDDLDPELEQLFRKRSGGVTRKPTEKEHTIQTADATELQRAAAGVERSKMNKAVRERFGSSVAAKLRKNPLELDSDSDFEEFMDGLESDEEGAQEARRTAPATALSAAPSFEVNKDEQDFLDRLIR